MELHVSPLVSPRTAHPWLRQVNLAYVPGALTPLLGEFMTQLLHAFQQQGHTLLPEPQDAADLLLTTASFGEPLNWRHALLLTGRARYRLSRTPTIFTFVHASPRQFHDLLDHFTKALARQVPDPKDYDFPGLNPTAYHTLHEQGRRGGAILALVRLLQSQTKSIRVVLVIGDERPLEAYTFDLVGAHPRSDASHAAFFEDLVLRIVTAVSTHEITSHQVQSDPIPLDVWQSLSTPPAMRQAGRQLGERNFFTEMVRIDNLVAVPAVQNAVASQYSEGCFATWDPQLNALIATITGSARPVDKDKLTDDELSVITGVRPDGQGAIVRHVQGKRNDPPSSEAVELMEMDSRLPTIRLGDEWSFASRVPVARSKLHGHRGMRAFDPRRVEHVYLDAPYYHYPVSCSTEAQAKAILAAFSRSQALANPDDPRQVVFTVLPGHGLVIVEKWVAGKEPFQVIWEYMDQGSIQIDNLIPQGPLAFVPDDSGLMRLQTL
ncbi:MAG: hypothetical protein PHS96_10985 [Anaerolineales bacterium]|nr:hypothetical protein [Anaerolineales bacterium]